MEVLLKHIVLCWPCVLPGLSGLQKRGKQPDFRLKTRGTEGVVDALWINDRRTPAWVKGNLQLLPGGKPYTLPSFIPPEALSGTPNEQQWVQVFEAYNQFWDNRVSVSAVPPTNLTAAHISCLLWLPETLTLLGGLCACRGWGVASGLLHSSGWLGQLSLQSLQWEL